MRGLRAGLSLSALLILGPPAAALDSDPVAGPRIEDLAWISGDWETAPGETTFDEHWTHPLAGTLIGMSRTVSGGKTVFFEYLRIETRADGIFYVAHPGGRSQGTSFKLVRAAAREAVFENPQHDFPKRIRYALGDDGTLTARVEGDGSESEKAQEYRFRRRGR